MRRSELTYNDLLAKSTKGLFENLVELSSFPIQNVDGKLVDQTFATLNGSKRLPKAVLSLLDEYTADETNKRLAEMLSLMYAEKWTRQNELLEFEVFGDKRKVTEKINDVGKAGTKATETDKVSAYDTDEFVNEKQKETQADNDTKNDRDRVLEETLNKSSELNDMLDRLQDRLIYDTIFTDVKRFVTLDIY
ncbi:TPA: hypothetical protein ACOBU0_002591 [Enterococcus faecium]|uniref:hypothetical protein n=1 Tax=Enterococcus faecium TaxID=1352 RepID=UPI001F20BA7E|nr:hypothetical protein [Enterococcus faecium]